VKSTLIILAVGFLLFEFVEHVVLPLIWLIKDRKKRSICGVTGMLGKVGEYNTPQKLDSCLRCKMSLS